ncbi:phenylalanine--tRNA ligase alpha subunit [Spirochaetota bacterium]|nr:phenylalanine--tRNA ligase alpha subunit [Spirochaetota bacterium]
MSAVTDKVFERLAEIIQELVAILSIPATKTAAATKSAYVTAVMSVLGMTTPEKELQAQNIRSKITAEPTHALFLEYSKNPTTTLKSRFAAAATTATVDALRNELIGRKGHVTALLHTVGQFSDHVLRKRLGQVTNQLKKTLQEIIDAKRASLTKESKSLRKKIDVTLPGYRHELGTTHPLTRVSNEILQFFNRCGFVTVRGPELESDYYNFEALNMPAHHPARATQDSFYLNPKTLLRTQTSNMQIRVAETTQPPIAIVSPGRVYRRDTIDATHSYTFHQIEGMYIDRHVSFSELKGILIAFCHHMFGTGIKIRFRPDYFPFTEPSCEISIGFQLKGKQEATKKSGSAQATENSPQSKNHQLDDQQPTQHSDHPSDHQSHHQPIKWLEVLGAGLMNPIVLENSGIDPKQYSGFAFGMGVERFAMIKHAIDDIRVFHENDVNFLNQLP